MDVTGGEGEGGTTKVRVWIPCFNFKEKLILLGLNTRGIENATRMVIISDILGEGGRGLK